MKTKKVDIKKLISKIKHEKKDLAQRLTEDLVHPAFRPAHRERDMRQEAIDMGSHGAAEYFGGEDAGTV